MVMQQEGTSPVKNIKPHQDENLNSEQYKGEFTIEKTEE